VAKGLVTALDEIKTDIPVVIRLSGTNAKEGQAIITDYGLPTVKTMSEAAKKAIELSKK
jgi:succinyl-CoA synthetase beta subunit